METRNPGNYGFWQTSTSSMAIARRRLSIAHSRLETCAVHGRPKKTKTPHDPVGVVGQKNEQLLPQKCHSGNSVGPFRQEKNGTYVLCVWHKRANQGRIACQRQPPRRFAAERVVTRFVINIAIGSCRPRNEEKREQRETVGWNDPHPMLRSPE